MKPLVTLATLDQERKLRDACEVPRTHEDIVKEAVLNHGYTLQQAQQLFPGIVTEEFYNQVTKLRATGPLQWDDMTTEEKKKYCRKYISEGSSLGKIGESVGAGWSKVRYFCKKHGIQIRRTKRRASGVRAPQKKRKRAASARSQ